MVFKLNQGRLSLCYCRISFLFNFFRTIDVSQLWSTVVVAMGIHAIDRRRSFGSALSIQLGLMLLIALGAAWFLTSRGL